MNVFHYSEKPHHVSVWTAGADLEGSANYTVKVFVLPSFLLVIRKLHTYLWCVWCHYGHAVWHFC